MKTSFFILFIFLFAFFSRAQLNKSSQMAGLRISYSQNKNDNSSLPVNGNITTNVTKQNNLNGAVSAGYFVENNFAIGIIIGTSITNYNTSQKVNQINSIGTYDRHDNEKIAYAGLFLRPYKMISEAKFGFFGNLSAVYQKGISVSQYTQTLNSMGVEMYSEDGNIEGYSVAISPGIVFFITKKIGLEASFGNLSYSSITTIMQVNGQSQTTSINSGLNVNFSATTFNIGITFYLASQP